MEERNDPSHPEVIDWETVFACLVFAIRSNSGIGFHNADQGHPFYVPGHEPRINEDGYGDGPEKNELFIMVRDLSRLFGRTGATGHPKIETWNDFCVLAYNAYLKDCERDRKRLPLMKHPED
jgi:hypothetical protein